MSRLGGTGTLPRAGRHDVACIALIGLFVLLRWWPLLQGHWRGDDSAILLHAMQARHLSAFWSPETWQLLSTGNLTPWVTLSFQIDLALAGAVPAAFYAHQLLAAMALTTAAYGLARHWLPPSWATGAVLLFMAGAPVATVVEDLMTRHYLEGLLLCLLALLAWLAALRAPGQRAWTAASLLAYALACTAKEIFVPLPLLLWAWPGLGGPLQRLRRVTPYLAVLVAYVLWRRWMLGVSVGGYAATETLLGPASLAAYIAALGRFPGHLFGPAAWLAGGVLLLALVLAWPLRSRVLALAALLAVLLLAPLLPLAISPGLNGPDRYLFGVWAGAVAGSVALLRAAALQQGGPAGWVAGIAPVRRNAVSGLAGLVGLAALFVAARWHDAGLAASRRQLHAEVEAFSRFVLTHGDDAVYRPTETLQRSFWLIDGLCQIKAARAAESGRLTDGSGRCPSPLLRGWAVPPRPQRLFDYDPARRALVDRSAELPQALRDATALDMQRPLSVDLSLRDGWARWQLGPATQGRYFIASPSLGRIELGASGQLRTPIVQAEFTIVYESPEGWATASQPLQIRRGTQVRWQRP